MLTPQLRRISQLDPLTNPQSQLSGAVTVWDVPMGPVPGAYKTMRGTPEDLAAYLALGALLKRASLTSARALLTGVAPAPTVDGGVLYAIEDTRWNGGPGATVYVHGLDTGQFAPVGYGPVGGKVVLVNVDVAAGKYTELVPPGQIWHYVGDPAAQSISIGELDLTRNSFDTSGLNEGNLFYAGPTVEDNTVGAAFSFNKVGLDFRRNQIGENCFDCDFQFSFTDNVLGENVNACYFDAGTQYVQVGDNCERVSLYNCKGTPQQPFVVPAGTKDAVYRNNKLVSANASLLVTAREDVFVDPTYAIPASYLNTALTIRTYNQASVAVTLPALTSADVPALLRIEHQSGSGGTTCLLNVPGVARPLRTSSEYALLAGVATPAIPPNPASGYPGAPAGTAWVVLTVSAQLLNPLSYPVMVNTAAGYVGYPTLAAANATAPQNIFLNQDVVLTQNTTLSANVFGRGRALRVSDGVTLKLFAYRTFNECRFELTGQAQTGKLATFGTSGQPGAKLRADECTQLVDCVVEVPIVMSYLDTQGITARGKTAIDNISGPGQLFLCDVCPDPATVGAGVLQTNLRPGASVAGPTTGIDYANPVTLSAAAGLLANTAYYVTGSGYQLDLPPPANNLGKAIFIEIAANASGLYPVSGSNLTAYASETMLLRATLGGWTKAGGELRPMVARIETSLSQQDAVTVDNYYTVPLSVAVNQVATLPALINLGQNAIVVQRTGRAVIAGSVTLKNCTPGGLYFIGVALTRGGQVLRPAQLIMAVGSSAGSGSLAQQLVTFTQACEPGDVLTLYTFAEGADANLRGFRAGSQCSLTYTEIV